MCNGNCTWLIIILILLCCCGGNGFPLSMLKALELLNPMCQIL